MAWRAHVCLPRPPKRPQGTIALRPSSSCGGKEAYWSDLPGIEDELLEQVTDALLLAGYAVFTADAVGHGERLHRNPHEAAWLGALPEGATKSLSESGVQGIIEYRTHLDYLSKRAEIDSTRIGAYGYSMGALGVYLLAAMDERVRVGVACVGRPVIMPAFPAFLSAYNYTPRLSEIPLLLLMGREDPAYTIEAVEEFHSRMPRSALVWYQSGHRLPSLHVDDAISWFTKHL